MIGPHIDPAFNLLRFKQEWQKARGEGIPVVPPAKPELGKGEMGDSLRTLQALSGKTIYRELMREADANEKRRWLPPASFSHDL